jgi:streptogramin lyase
MEYDTPSVALKKSFQIPPDLKSYSIYVDSERKCLITDIANHRLVSVNPDSTFEEYRWPSVREPYSVTFLSTGTLCIAARNQSAGTNGGIAVLSETDLKTSA